jgi:putative inorganic carbon (hco3(-)) transporter
MLKALETPISVSVLQLSFLALIASLGWMTSGIRFSGIAVQVTDAIFLPTLFLTVILTARGVIAAKYDRIFLALLFYFIALSLSAVFSEQPQRSAIKLAGETYLILLLILTLHIVSTVGFLRKVFLAWVVTGGIVGIVGVLTVVLFYVAPGNPLLGLTLHHYGSLPPGPYPRVQSTFIYPAMLCNYLSAGLLIALASYRLGWLAKTTFNLSFWPMLVTAAFTVTPGIGGLLFALGLWFAVDLQSSGKRILPRVSFVSGTVLAVTSIIVSAFTFRHISTSPYHFELLGMRIDPTQRYLTWQGALETFIANPIFGKGLGLGVAQVMFIAPSGQRQMLTDAHNMWLNVAAEAGILGLLGILSVCILVVFRTLPFRFGKDPLNVARIAIGIALISGFIVQSMVGSFENARHLWVLFGLLLAISEIQKTASHKESK